ncbi:hypothetical protein BGZ70_009118 [Mortierella alpina]|uniref:C2H2-type domain-containing protein n=1 Tax=Mortierella alpina TaxID=64518 RepID=A0A9P6J202_MORAP|nr:hypothetical protein BGZ70_009118 [Mortierella alpina]
MRSKTSVPQAMMIDDDEDEEDDGEIKQDTRTRRSVSVSGPDGSAKKPNQQPQSSLDQDHSEVHKCMDCGKVYKHPNCLWKHRWLHSVYWKGATKFLLSKHQQVQLMEAAAILLGMDESREGDKDPIVSMFSKQRGAMANSVGSSASGTSSSSSPPTSTKSLSASPPPASERVRHGSARTDVARAKVDPPHNSDIQMLTALRHSHGHASGPSPPSRVPSSTATVSSTKSPRAAKDSPKAVTTSPLPSPTHSKSATSSSSSTPPTLTADDESLPEMDEEMATVTPPSHTVSISSAMTTVQVADKGSVVMGMGMGLGMEVDQKPLPRQNQLPPPPQQPPPQPHYRVDVDSHGAEYRYAGYQHQQQHQPTTTATSNYEPRHV